MCDCRCQNSPEKSNAGKDCPKCEGLMEDVVVFHRYRRTNIAEMRDYVKGEDLTCISVSDVDNPESDMGMIARNPKCHADQWYVARKYFGDNFEKE